MKKIFVILLLIFLSLPALGNDAPLNSCFKGYNKGQDDIYLLSIAAINKNRFEILEMQSKSGYILFRAYAKDYLLTVSPQGMGSNVKILPVNSNFSGGVNVQTTIFAALDTLNASGSYLKKVL